jgi:N-acetylneuraminate synthase
MKSFKIGNILIGEKYNPIVMPEIGINHKGDVNLAIYMVDKAIKAGAEIIKHQTHIVDDEMSYEAKKIKPANAAIPIYDLIKKSSLNEKDEKKLMNYILGRKKIFISTPFSRKAAQRLANFGVPAFKIGSGECNNYPLVEYIAKFKKPIILSTGMNSIDTIRPSVKIFRKYKIPYALLHCTNIYPTPARLVRINCITLLKENFPDAVVGLSDHTESIYTSIASIALGASIIEKHFTDSKKRKGPDISSSMDSSELKELIKATKEVYLSRGNTKKSIPEEKKTINFAFASIAATKDILKGETFNSKNIFPLRPNSGYFKVKDYQKLIGKKSRNNIKKGFQLKKNDV